MSAIVADYMPVWLREKNKCVCVVVEGGTFSKRHQVFRRNTSILELRFIYLFIVDASTIAEKTPSPEHMVGRQESCGLN